MKKIILLSMIILTLSSCGITKEDSQVNTVFLINSYKKEFHELNLANKELTQVPNFEKYLSGSIIDDVWSINLQANKITEIDAEKLKFFPNLKELNISYNTLSTLNLSDVPLDILYAHKNKLTTVNIEKLNTLSTLNLGYNELKSWNDIKLPTALVTLELQHNKLDDLYWIESLLKLEKLKFEFNNLEDDDMNVLLNLDNISNITATYNKLSKKVEDKITELNTVK